jgi:hypothetical protein
MHSFRTLEVSLPSHEFVRPPCCKYRFYKIKESEIVVASNDTNFSLNFVKIRQLDQHLKGAYADSMVI